MATLELGVADGAFAEFLSSLVSVGTETKTVAFEPETCSETDGETVDSGVQETSVASGPDSETLEDTSSQQITQVFGAIVQSAPQAAVVGIFSPEPGEEEPTQEVAHAAAEANGVSVAAGDSADTRPAPGVEKVEVTGATKRKTEASFSKDADLAQGVVKTKPMSSRVEDPTPAPQSDGQAQQLANDATLVEKISSKYSSDQSSDGVLPVFHSVVGKSSLTSKPNDPTFPRSRIENPVAVAAIGDASVKSIETGVSSAAITDRIPAQQSGEKHGEPGSERTVLLHAQTTASQIATVDSGEPMSSGMKVSSHVTHDTLASRNAGNAQEMQVALNTDMGKVHIRAELGKDDRLSAVVRADHQETGAILAEQVPVLERALAEKDISLGSFQVASGATGFGQSSNHSSPHRGQFERFSVATFSASNETATREQESYEPEERKLSVRV